MLDVTIVFERHPQTLELAFRAKQQKYKILRELLEHQLGIQQIEIQGFPVGVRGKSFPHNSLVLEKLGERNVRRTAIKISKMTLLMSLDIVTNFGTPGVRSAAPSNGDRLAHRHGQFCRSPSGSTAESNYGQGSLPVPFRPRSARTG